MWAHEWPQPRRVELAPRSPALAPSYGGPHLSPHLLLWSRRLLAYPPPWPPLAELFEVQLPFSSSDLHIWLSIVGRSRVPFTKRRGSLYSQWSSAGTVCIAFGRTFWIALSGRLSDLLGSLAFRREQEALALRWLEGQGLHRSQKLPSLTISHQIQQPFSDW